MQRLQTDASLIPDQICGSSDVDKESIALSQNNRYITYGRLNQEADSFAGYLAARGVAPGGTVAICLERSFEGIVAALGTMRAAAAYVPLDPSWPESRLRYAIADSGASVLVSSAPFFDKLGLDICGIEPFRDAEAIAENRHRISRTVTPHSLAYVIYTSGSTGVPKGVEITHANLANLTNWHREAFRITPWDRASHFAGLGFDAAVWEIWPNLCAGTTLVLPDDAVRWSAELMQQWLIRERITISFVPTIHAESMIAMQWPADTALRYLLTGGDTLQKSPPSGLPFDVVNNYGLTECSVVSTSGVLSPDSDERPSIGRPIGETSIYLLNEFGKPVPGGVAGEIYIGGAGVGRGYRNLDDSTAQFFLPDPFSRTPGARMFRTGDRAIRLPNGELHFLGRLDRQIKIRGQRVELDEIGAVLSRHPGIEFATAITRPSETGTQLVACFLPRKGLPDPTANELRTHLLNTLPDYMVPSTFIRLEKAPLSANGKLDLKELDKWTELNSRETTSTEQALSPIAEKLLALVRQLLENNAVTAAENFFLAGGHSLLAMQLLIRIEEAFGLKLAVHQLFEAPTVGDLAILIGRVLDESRLANIWKHLLGLQEVGLDDDFYSVGGNPKRAAALRKHIASEFRCEITIAELKSNPTIRRQAELTQGHATTQNALPPGVLALRRSGSRSRIFWVHYLNTNLARVIGDDQPFFSVTLTPDDVESLGENATLKSIASCLAAKIQATQPSGPYILGGLCLGGVLAYEIASQLRAVGEEVNLLVLIDPPNLVCAENRNSLSAKWTYFRYLMKRAEWLGPKASLLYLHERIVKHLPSSLKRSFNIPNPNAAQQLIESAVYSYGPDRYNGRVLLLLAAGRISHASSLAGWRLLVPFILHTQYINAYHRELMDSPNVEEIACAIVHHLSFSDHNNAASSFRNNYGSAGATNSGDIKLDVALQQK